MLKATATLATLGNCYPWNLKVAERGATHRNVTHHHSKSQ